MLGGTILELCKSCLVLLENLHYSAIPILLRSIAESLFDLEITLEKDTNYKFFLAKYHEEKIKQLRRLEAEHKDNNQAMKIISEQLIQCEREFKKLKNEGISPLKTKDKIEKCKENVRNKIIYNLFCSDTHNDLSALEKRHLTEKVDGTVELTYFSEPDDIHILSFFDGILASALQTIYMLSTPFKSISTTTVNVLIKKYETIGEAFSKINQNAEANVFRPK